MSARRKSRACLTSFDAPIIELRDLGAVTPIGRTAATAAAAVRAGIARFTEHAFMVDSEGEPMHLAQCPWLEDMPVERRISACLLDAIAQVLVSSGSGLPGPLFVDLPLPRPGLPDRLARQVHDAVTQRYPRLTAIEVCQRGHAGGALALDAAFRHLRVNPERPCVVAGADSYCDPDTLEWLEQTDQLHGAGPRNNAWGFMPGEGAGALLVAARSRGQGAGLPRLLSTGVGQETRLIRTGTVCIGEGLTAAFRGALVGLAAGQCVTDVYCDLNGDTYRADEFAFAVTRTRERFVSASDFVAPADCWGDVGAASVPLGVILACAAGARGYARGTHALVWASSDGGQRGAALLAVCNGRAHGDDQGQR